MHGFYVSDESGTHFGAYSLTYTQILGMNANIGYNYVYDRKSGY